MAIFWDFDGVILNSMVVRDQGFVEVLKDYDDRDVEELLAFHRKNGGLSRYVKFTHFFENIIEDQSFGGKDLKFYTDEFSRIMKKLLTNPELLISDSVDFIKRCHSEGIPMHIVSGSDGNELRYLCAELGIASYFLSINGSPTPKTDLVSNVLDEYKYAAKECVLIGDSINDYDAAEKNGLRFKGYNNEDLRKFGSYIDSFNNSTTNI